MLMSEQQHTSGPWHIDSDADMHDPGFYGVAGDPRGYHSIEAGSWRLTGFIGDANARLISAAPELLEALEELEDAASVTADSRVDAARRAARAAIAKAIGR